MAPEKNTTSDIAHEAKPTGLAASGSPDASVYLELATVMFIALDTKGRVTLANPKACEILGYDCDQIINQDWFSQFIPERLRQEVRSVFDRLMAGEVAPVRYVENQVLTASGEERTIGWHNTYLPGDDGDIVGVLASGDDITEKKRMEELLATELDLAIALGSARGLADGARLCTEAALKVSALDCAGAYILDRSSGSMELVYKSCHAPEQSAGCCLSRSAPPDPESLASRKPIYTSCGGCTSPHGEGRGCGQSKAMAIMPLSHEERVVGCLRFHSSKLEEVPEHARVALETIAAQVGAAIAGLWTKEEVRSLSSVVEQSTHAVAILNDHGVVEYVNPAFCESFRMTQDEVAGKKWGQWASPESPFRERIDAMLPDILEGRRIMHEELADTGRDGQTVWRELSAFPVRDEVGNATHVAFVSQDVTARKHTEKDLRDAFAEIRELKDKLETENTILREKIRTSRANLKIVAESDAMQSVLDEAEKVGKTDSTVLLTGETGAGKEVLAYAIHGMSPRSSMQMLTVNCASMPESLIESELFGREKGAFTGAVDSQVGRFELADGSTIFLDEVGELPLATQSKLLRILQDGTFERLGSSEPRSVDVRVIAATNRDLEREISEGRFRQDLFYRLNVFPIVVPPLRERVEDIEGLALTFVEELGARMGKRIEAIDPDTLGALKEYSWPGNVRELRNIIERAMILCRGTVLCFDVPEETEPCESADIHIEDGSLDDMERSYILQILERTDWRVRGDDGAAALLGLKPTTLHSRMKKLGISREDT